MSSLSDYLEQQYLQITYNGASWTPPATTYVALATTLFTDAGAGTEVSGGSYARILVNAAGGASPAWSNWVADGDGHKIDNVHLIQFATATASWGTIVGFGVFSAITGGNLLDHGSIGVPRVIGIADIFKFLVGQLKIRRE
jgi:hypothetical protein